MPDTPTSPPENAATDDPAISKAERELIRVLERKGKRGFLYGKSLERPLVRYRRYR